MKTASLVLLTVLSLPALASIDAYPFPNDELRDRYHTLIEELRCPQCLNTNLAGSDAMIAQDLRREVHRMLLEGMSDEEILDFMHERYGDFILYKPRVAMNTLALWFIPFILFLLAGIMWVRLTRMQAEADDLSAEEQARLDKLLSKDS